MENRLNNNPGAGGMAATILWVGKAIGLAAALFAAPLAYGLSKVAIYGYFVTFVGAGAFAVLLTWIVVALEVVVIFGMVALGMAFLMSWLMTALVMRGLR